MKHIEVKRLGFTIVDDSDFDYLSQFHWEQIGNGYVGRQKYLGKINGKYKWKKVYMHREIMGFPEGLQVDHKNRNKLDNRRENLRVCNSSENQSNRPSKANSSSRYKGVRKVHSSAGMKTKTWTVEIRKNNKIHRLGYFETEEQAALAYNKAAQELQGEFAYLNEVL